MCVKLLCKYVHQTFILFYAWLISSVYQVYQKQILHTLDVIIFSNIFVCDGRFCNKTVEKVQEGLELKTSIMFYYNLQNKFIFFAMNLSIEFVKCL